MLTGIDESKAGFAELMDESVESSTQRGQSLEQGTDLKSIIDSGEPLQDSFIFLNEVPENLKSAGEHAVDYEPPSQINQMSRSNTQGGISDPFQLVRLQRDEPTTTTWFNTGTSLNLNMNPEAAEPNNNLQNASHDPVSSLTSPQGVYGTSTPTDSDLLEQLHGVLNTPVPQIGGVVQETQFFYNTFGQKYDAAGNIYGKDGKIIQAGTQGQVPTYSAPNPNANWSDFWKNLPTALHKANEITHFTQILSLAGTLGAGSAFISYFLNAVEAAETVEKIMEIYDKFKNAKDLLMDIDKFVARKP